MTMAQFLEMRYSRRLRIFAGILCWTSGVINFGIFPAVAARFFIYFCGLPDHFHATLPNFDITFPFCHLQSYSLPSIALVMLIDLGLALSFVNMGGQISVMITEVVQGMFCSFAFVIVSAVVLIKIHWGQMVTALEMAPANASMLNPFHTSGVGDYNIYYYLVGLFGAFYSYMSWQGSQGFYSCARNPHEQKMGGIISVWRSVPHGLMTALIALAGISVLRLPQFSHEASLVAAALDRIPNESIQSQMRIPIALSMFLPTAVKGLLATVFLFYSFTCHDTYMHSWGSIFVQDIYMPIRNKAIDPEHHIKLLRWSIMGVAVFAFIFSLVYVPTEDILFFFAITGTIWSGGSGAVIIGGLYWKRGTTAAAYGSLITGALFGGGGLILTKMYRMHHGHDIQVILHHGKGFTLNNQYIFFIAMITALLVYITVSLITSRGKKPYNLERMLHRGKYSVATDHVKEQVTRSRWAQIVGITKEFSKSDKILAVALLVWNGAWFVWFVVFSIINLLYPVSDSIWADYHLIHTIIIPAALSLPITIWFTVGGIHDIRHLFKALATAVRDPSDDGRFHGYKDDESPEECLIADSQEEAVLVVHDSDETRTN